MATDPALTPVTPNLPEQATPTALPAPPGEPAPSRLELWVARVQVFVESSFFIWLGMCLIIAPWHEVWTHNSVFAPQSSIRAFLNLGFVRGAVTGLGLVNIWVGIWDAVHYTEK